MDPILSVAKRSERGISSVGNTFDAAVPRLSTPHLIG